MAVPAVTRDQAEAALARQESFNVIDLAAQTSAVLATADTHQMRGETLRIPVQGDLPDADFVGESGGGEIDPADQTDVKPKSALGISTLTLRARTLAVIVVIPEEVVEDDETGLTNRIQGRCAEALGARLDEAVLFGAQPNRPSDWPASIFDGAVAAGRVITEGDGRDLAADINLAWGEVEDGDFDVNVQYARRRLRTRLRGLRTDDGAPVFVESLRDDSRADSLMGEDILYVRNGSYDDSEATAIVGDRNHLHVGMRLGAQFRILTEAPITDGAGGVVSLAERDLIAVRARFRVAYELSVPQSRDQTADPFPFAVVVPPAA